MNKAIFQAKAHTTNKVSIETLKASGFAASRPDGFAAELAAFHYVESDNYRSIDLEHVETLATSICNGGEIKAILASIVNINGEDKLSIIGGNHTYLAVNMVNDWVNTGDDRAANRIAVNKKPLITKLDVNIFKGDKTQKLIAAMNDNGGRPASVLENAKGFQQLRADGLSNKQIHEQTGHRPSVIANSLALLKGDSDILELVEKNEISATRARNLIKQYGSEAAQYAKFELQLKNNPEKLEALQSELPATTNNKSSEQQLTIIEGELESTDAPQQQVSVAVKAAKKPSKNVLDSLTLSKGKTDRALKLIKLMGQRVDLEAGTISLPVALLEEVAELAVEMENIDTRNKAAMESIAK